MIRRYDDPPRRDQTYHHRPGAYAILLRGNEILLTYQAVPEPEYQLPGGGIDPGESPIQGLHREVFEETGYHMTGARRLGAFRRFVYMPEYDKWAEKLCHIYVARPTLRHGPPSEPDHTPIWLPKHAALAILDGQGNRDFLAALLEI